MNKLQPNEKRLVAIAMAALVFLLFWYGLLNPQLVHKNKALSEINTLQQKLDLLIKAPQITGYAREKFDVFSQEDQLNHILTFIDKKFRWFGIKLLSSRQTFVANRLTIQLSFESTYYQLTGFLNSLTELNTILVIEKAVVNQSGNRVIVDLTLLSGYL
ncbi:MAG: type II secretion system protein GspM [bacterium]